MQLSVCIYIHIKLIKYKYKNISFCLLFFTGIRLSSYPGTQLLGGSFFCFCDSEFTPVLFYPHYHYKDLITSHLDESFSISTLFLASSIFFFLLSAVHVLNKPFLLMYSVVSVRSDSLLSYRC